MLSYNINKITSQNFVPLLHDIKEKAEKIRKPLNDLDESIMQDFEINDDNHTITQTILCQARLLFEDNNWYIKKFNDILYTITLSNLSLMQKDFPEKDYISASRVFSSNAEWCYLNYYNVCTCYENSLDEISSKKYLEQHLNYSMVLGKHLYRKINEYRLSLLSLEGGVTGLLDIIK